MSKRREVDRSIIEQRLKHLELLEEAAREELEEDEYNLKMDTIRSEEEYQRRKIREEYELRAQLLEQAVLQLEFETNERIQKIRRLNVF